MRYSLVGLDCPNCALKLERELRKINGLENINVNFNTLSVEMPATLEEEARAVIKRVEPEVKLQKAESFTSFSSDQEAEHNGLWAIIAAGLLFAIGSIFNQSLHDTPFSWAEYAVLVTAYLLVGWPVILAAFRKLVRGEYFDENFLMMIATVGAIAIHQLPEAVGVMLFMRSGILAGPRRQSLTSIHHGLAQYSTGVCQPQRQRGNASGKT